MSLTSESVEAQLLHIQFRNLFVQWGKSSPTRTSMHASAVLQSESEWCLREQVLLGLYPNKVEKPELHPWHWKQQAIFLNGWSLHERWQKLFLQHGWAVVTDGIPELDKTHYDEVRNIHFSPDAILEWGKSWYIVEIKGIKHESYESLTDDFQQACEACETVAKARVQANLYMHLTSITQAIILVENKNTQDFRLYLMEYDRELVKPYLDRIYDVKKWTTLSKQDESRVPARRCASASESRAVRCPLRRVCFGEDHDSK